MWFNYVTQLLDAEDIIKEQLQLGIWLGKTQFALQRYIREFERMKADPSSQKFDLKMYGHYWYIQEFKYNRQVEFKIFLDLIISRLRWIESRYADELVRLSVFIMLQLLIRSYFI